MQPVSVRQQGFARDAPRVLGRDRELGEMRRGGVLAGKNLHARLRFTAMEFPDMSLLY